MNGPFQPLRGVIVLDLSRYLPGPLLTRILADLGARVIKVEPPQGEGLRHVLPDETGVGPAFASLNAGKDSLALNLKLPEGQALCRALVAEADILVESFRPGVMSRLGLDPEALMAEHPQLILCSLSGYGQHTPMRHRAGHDLNYMARSGLLGIQGPPQGPPQVPGANVSDVAGGSYPAAMGVLAALLERNQTGVGRWLDVSLTRSVIGFNPVLWSSSLQGTPRGRDMLTGAAPCYRCYETSDGRYMAVGALEPNFWSNLCRLAEAPELVPLQYDTRPEAHAQVAKLFAGKTQQEWVDLVGDHDVCLEPVLSPDEAMADPAIEATQVQAGPYTVMPVHLGATPPTHIAPPSALGADLDAVCTELGVDFTLVQAARDAGATGDSP